MDYNTILYTPVNTKTGKTVDIFFNSFDECKEYCDTENELMPQEYIIKDENHLTVVYAADRNLYPYLPTVINSLLINNPDAKVYVFAEDDTINTLIHPNVTIINYNIFKNRLLPTSPQSKYYIPFPTFIRLWIADKLSESKVLWLDVDTIVDGSLEELKDLEMGDNVIAAVFDCQWNIRTQISDRYINAGVMVMNLDEWRRLGFTERATEMLNKERWQYGDQDIINKLCKGKVIFLNGRYNYGSRWINTTGTENPIKIYHWPGKPKQWDSRVIHDRMLWQKYYTPELMK